MEFCKSSDQVAKKILTVLLIIFLVSCLKLCAEDVSPSQAKELRNKFVAEAKSHVGSPYVLGATGPDTFDCSGLIYYTARQSIGYQLPRTAAAIYKYCKTVPDNQKESGDLLFFKTNSSAPVTHVGIYIGNNQFISAISDGPNSGVIISSLNQSYWKPKYVGCGRFIKSAKNGNSAEDSSDTSYSESSTENHSGNLEKSKTKTNFKGSSFYNPDSSFLQALTFDASAFVNWSLFSPNKFMLLWRGADLQANVRLSKWILEPGLGLALRYNHGLGILQIPLTLSATVNDYVRFYAGPVITIGEPSMIESEEKISASFFPGLLGISFSTPSFAAGAAKIQVVQDISYSVFNHKDNSALSFVDSLSAGLVFFTGVRVTLGMGTFLGK